MRDAQTSTSHLIHPRPVKGQELFEIMGRELSLPLRPFAEWVRALESVATNANINGDHAQLKLIGEKVPSIKLMEFFRGGLDAEHSMSAEDEAMGIPKLVMTEALRASSSLRSHESTQGLGAVEVQQWLEYWQAVGFLPKTDSLQT